MPVSQFGDLMPNEALVSSQRQHFADENLTLYTMPVFNAIGVVFV